jgi:hypothetical protein
MIVPTLLTFHLLLFGVKIWAVFMFAKRFKSYPYMFTWSVFYLFSEAIFLHLFFMDIDLYLYEIFAVIDQAIFTIGLVFYLTKEVHNGKRTH